MRYVEGNLTIPRIDDIWLVVLSTAKCQLSGIGMEIATQKAAQCAVCDHIFASSGLGSQLQ
jgi:hypothetical protein